METLKDVCTLGKWGLIAIGVAWLLLMLFDAVVYLAFVKKVAEECGDKDCYEPPKEYDAPEDR